jgi:predicted transcriptional regulator
MSELIVIEEVSAMRLPDAQAVSDYIKCADLAPGEIDALEHAAEVLNDCLFDVALAFLPLAAKVRSSVLYEFAAFYGLDRAAVDAVVREGAASLNQKKQDHREVVRVVAEAKRAEGATLQQIADELGSSKQRVSEVLVSPDSGLTNTDCRVKADEDVVAEVCRLAEAGEKQGDIAKATGISRPRVNQILNGKTGNESKQQPIQLPIEPSAGSAPRSSDHHHSQPIHLMLQEGSGPHEEMIANRKRYYDNIERCFKDIQSIEKRLKTLSRYFQNTYAKEHGGMVANWAAYQRIWAEEMRDNELIGCDTFDGVRQRLASQLRILSQQVSTSLDVLQKINSLPIIIED